MSDYKLYGTKWAAAAGTTTITYNFSQQPIAFNYTNMLSATEQQLVRTAMQAWSNVANVTFKEVTSNADLTFGWDHLTGNKAHAYAWTTDYSYSVGAISKSVIEYNLDAPSTDLVNIDQNHNAGGIDHWSFFQTTLHELGHTLGLDHMSSSSSLMNPVPYTAVVPDSGSIAGVDSLYGAATHPAVDLHTLAPAGFTFVNDHGAVPVTPTVTPTGSTSTSTTKVVLPVATPEIIPTKISEVEVNMVAPQVAKHNYFLLTLGDHTKAITAHFTTIDSGYSAQPNVDYIPTTLDVVIPAGTNTQLFGVTILPDHNAEPDEQFNSKVTLDYGDPGIPSVQLVAVHPHTILAHDAW